MLTLTSWELRVLIRNVGQTIERWGDYNGTMPRTAANRLHELADALDQALDKEREPAKAAA